MNRIKFLLMIYLTGGIISCSPAVSDVIGTDFLTDEIKYAKASKVQKIRIKLPENYNIEKNYPVLILLHGNGGNAYDMSEVFASYKKFPVIIAIPEGQYPKSSIAGYSWYFETNSKQLWERFDILAAESIMETVNELKNSYRCSDFYIMGFSQGASLAYMTGLLFPQKIKGVAAIGGILPEIDIAGSTIKSTHIENAKYLKLLIARGISDPLVEKKIYDQQVEFFKSHKFSLMEYEYQGGHNLSQEIILKIFQWIITISN